MDREIVQLPRLRLVSLHLPAILSNLRAQGWQSELGNGLPDQECTKILKMREIANAHEETFNEIVLRFLLQKFEEKY